MYGIEKIEKDDHHYEQYQVGTPEEGVTLEDVKRLKATAYPKGDPERFDFIFSGFLESMMDHRSPRDEMSISGVSTREAMNRAIEEAEDALDFARLLSGRDWYHVYRMAIVIGVIRRS